MFSIILAAGKGTRMGAIDRPKVCLEVGGVPVIVRALETYTRCGIERHILVVGDRAGEVMETVCRRFPQSIFAYQAEQRGTGHAARCGAAVLDAFDYQGDVLIVVGDRILSDRTVVELLERFRAARADLCITVGAKEDCPDAGRVIEDAAGNVLANVEVSDLARARLIGRWFDEVLRGPIESSRLRAQLHEAFPTERKARRAFPKLWPMIEQRESLSADDLAACCSPGESLFQFEEPDGKVRRFTADEIERRTRYVNLSVYCFRAEALRYALARLGTANAQGEEYLTDAIGILASARDESGRRRFRVIRYAIAGPSDALTFNTPEELEAVRQQIHRATRNPT